MECIPVGVSFYKEAVNKLQKGDKLELRHEPVFVGKKEYPNAVAIYSQYGRVGSLAESSHPDSPQQRVLSFLKRGEKITAEVVEVLIPQEGETWQRTFRMDINLPSIRYIKSFNEDVEVVFDEEQHVYTYEGEKLLSGSEFASQGENFNKEAVANGCARAWDVPVGEIKDLWDSNTEVSVLFGQAVHKALEHYATFRELGKKLEAKTGENKALPKHPFLRKIIQDFHSLVGDKKILPEVFITDIKNKRCGQVDILQLTGEKSCRIGDYKVNAGGEKKMDKYRKQLNFYADIMRNTGWQVEGTDLYILEDKWKHYENI